jgi:hypothetical protein
VIDDNKIPKNRGGSSILPPKVYEQLGGQLPMGVARKSEPLAQKTDFVERPKRELRFSALRGFLIVVSILILAMFCFEKPIKNGLRKWVGGHGKVRPEVSSTPVFPLRPRVSVPIPTDAEINASPVPPLVSFDTDLPPLP